MKLIKIEETHSWVPGGHEGSLSREIATATQGATQVSVHTTTLAPGGLSEPERHPTSEQVFVVLSGELVFRDGLGTEFASGPGTAVFIPINAPHAVTNEGTEDAVVLVITAPPPP